MRLLASQWDLTPFLHALGNPPFKSLIQISLKLLPFKTYIHLTITSAKTVSDLCTLSISPSLTEMTWKMRPITSAGAHLIMWHARKASDRHCSIESIHRENLWLNRGSVVVWSYPTGIYQSREYPQTGVCAHSTRALSSATALLRGMTVEDTCMAASQLHCVLMSSPICIIQFSN